MGKGPRDNAPPIVNSEDMEVRRRSCSSYLLSSLDVEERLANTVEDDVQVSLTLSDRLGGKAGTGVILFLSLDHELVASQAKLYSWKRG